MSETLIIAGETFENVAGFKVLDSSSVTQTYIKPSGIKQISISSNGTTTEDVNSYASAQINVAVPNTYAAGDEGKVVSSGALITQGSAEYNINGTYDTTLVSRIDIAVSGSSPTGTININNNGVYNVSTYASASVLVPNSYNVEDEGKVVSSGALVVQSSATYSSNGSYDTTLVSSIQVEVPGVEPSGTISISSNGEYDVAAYASASVNVSGGGGPTIYYERHGIMYTENMVIPEKDSGNTTISTPRYIREQFQGATFLKSYIQQYGTPQTDTNYGLFRQCSNLETVWVARNSFDGGYIFEGCNALKHITLGRVGLAVTAVRSGIFNGSGMKSIEDITVYVNASDLSGVPTNVKDRITPSYSHGAVITYKNYESGETIATVTVP